MPHLKIDRSTTGSEVVIVRDTLLVPDQSWRIFSAELYSLIQDMSLVGDSLKAPIGEYLLRRKYVQGAINKFRFDVEYSESMRSFAGVWNGWKRKADALLKTGVPSDALSPVEIDSCLIDEGWSMSARTPTPEQYRNIGRLAVLPSGANFSVPGSGKTTSALANHFVAKARGEVDCLLVVAPRSAFKEWKEALETVVGQNAIGFLPLIDGRYVPSLLASNPKFALITYHQLVRVIPSIENFLSSRRVHLVLDESHRIKAGSSGAFAKACLRISPLASRRDILSGTPMPQSPEDLVPQLDFLFPGMGVGGELIEGGLGSPSLKNFYARTTYRELGLKPIVVKSKLHEMTVAHQALYSYLRDDLVRLHASVRYQLDEASSAQICVMRLLQSAIDPQLAARSILASDDAAEPLRDIARIVIDEGDIGARLKGVISEAREYALKGRKTVIWAPFVDTISMLCDYLSDLGAQPIFGRKTKALDDENEYIEREDILNEFLDDDRQDRWALVVNAAAGSEGISLHRVCQHAIYAGRTYNAANYMQSRDRINRLDMPAGTTATMTIHEVRTPAGVGSIDEHIDKRLSAKILQMGEILDDDDLRAMALDGEDLVRADSDIPFDEILDLIMNLERA